METKVRELVGNANEEIARLSSSGAFLVFTWLLLLFFGTMDLTGFLFTGQWHGFIRVGIIAACITLICLIIKKGYARGLTIADLVGLGIASFAIGGSLALV
ncbi:MAG: hypothetical protein KAX23_00185 [Dehalococcoidia bacterium]|nr:hypothetical protein [Chloroflexota bacterium]MCK4241948.1 hypothetical protein [Dehalococcoidia bacterium]